MINVALRGAYAWGVVVLVYVFVTPGDQIFIALIGGFLVGIGSVGWRDPD